MSRSMEAASGESASSSFREGLESIQRANARQIGTTEFRDVTMVIGDRRRLRILTLRHSEGSIARTVFCVAEPRTFRNVNYVATEHRGRVEPFLIDLYLPYVRGSLRRLPSHRRRESHLGSDFSYDDLRTWLYEQDHRYQTIRSDETAVVVRGVCTKNPHLVRHGTEPFDVWLDRQTAFVLRVEYLSSGHEIVRQYRAEDITSIDGILIAGRMTMVDLARRHRTVILLERAWFDRPIDEDAFVADRSHTWEYLRDL